MFEPWYRCISADGYVHRHLTWAAVLSVVRFWRAAPRQNRVVRVEREA